MQLETERLILRPWEDEDAEELYRYAGDERVGPAAGWPPHTCVEESLEIIRTVFSGPETYAMVLKSTKKPVGCVGAMFFPAGNLSLREREAEIGYWIGVPHWGQGLTTEAVQRIVRRCFEDLGCEILWCGHYDGNERSRGVQEACGFRYHHTELAEVSTLGEIRAEHFYCLTRGEFLRNKRSDSGK